AAEREHAANDGPVAGEPAHPEAVTEYDDERTLGTILLPRERTAVQRARAEHAEVLLRYVQRREVLGWSAVDEVDPGIRGLVRPEMAANPDALLPGDELRDRGVERVAELRRIVGDHDLDDLVGVGIGERAQQQGVDDREDRGVRPDADREHGDCRDGESPRAPEQPPGMADIASDVLQEARHA